MPRNYVRLAKYEDSGLSPEQVAERKWNSVKDSTPTKNGEYLCEYRIEMLPSKKLSDKAFRQVLEYYATDKHPHFQHESVGVVVTRWMPIPPTKET